MDRYEEAARKYFKQEKTTNGRFLIPFLVDAFRWYDKQREQETCEWTCETCKFRYHGCKPKFWCSGFRPR
jgi:hypothetical protein